MHLFFLILASFAIVFADHHEGHEECPAFGDWLPWTDQCLWFPQANMRQGINDACRTNFTVSRSASSNFTIQWPDKCGHCAFKFRCRKRATKEGCLSIDGEKQVCDEFGDVCTMPKHPKLGCRWGALGAIRGCLNRADLPDWRREAYEKLLSNLPEGNCIEKDGQCKCCCHPYKPSDDGASCVKEEMRSCDPFGKWNEWSQCLWYPMQNIAKNILQHCNLEYEGDISADIAGISPAGFQVPEKCGFCSFKARCRKREKKDGCFQVQADKKACGSDDCPTCGDICDMPKLNNTCEWGRMTSIKIIEKVSNFTASMPYWRKRGVRDLLRHVPWGACKEVGERCKCCCHPYEPNADGTACVVAAGCN